MMLQPEKENQKEARKNKMYENLPRTITIRVHGINEHGNIVYEIQRGKTVAPAEAFPPSSGTRKRLDELAELHRQDVIKNGSYEFKLSEAEILYAYNGKTKSM